MSKIISTKDKWLDWAIKLQGLSQAGLYYTDNEFERERYREIRNIANEILQTHSTIEIDQIDQYFNDDTGYKTPKLDSRSVVFKDDKILMAQESNGFWSIPGGWVDIDQTLSQNLIKEAHEEAGAQVVPKFVIAIHDWRSHVDIEFKRLPFQVVKIFVMCDLKSINFCENSETLQADFFAHDDLPKMALAKNNYEQVDLCFKAHEAEKSGKTWNAVFD